MHSHAGLQEQLLLAAPLIVRSAADLAADRQEVVVMLHDFSFRTPDEILAGLTGMAAAGHGGMNHRTMTHGAMNHGTMGQAAAGADLNDVDEILQAMKAEGEAPAGEWHTPVLRMPRLSASQPLWV